jgi:hypothetical protein
MSVALIVIGSQLLQRKVFGPSGATFLAVDGGRLVHVALRTSALDVL